TCPAPFDYQAHGTLNEPEIMRRAKYFAFNDQGFLYFWDSQDVTNPQTHEYRIYFYDGGYNVYPLAATFEEFMDIAIIGRNHPLYTEDNEVYEPEWKFWPAYRPHAKPPPT